MIVEIPISAADLADTMGAMRDWLDTAHCTPTRFETQRGEEPGAVMIRVEFNEGAEAEAFRRAFDSVAA
jgi:hypothetical protein